MNYLVNADYEQVLFQDIASPPSKSDTILINIARQYLFYYINKDPNATLYSSWHLPEKTKDYFESIGVKLPHHTKSLNSVTNWYGQLKNLELERKLNNKLSVIELLQTCGDLPRDVHIVTRPEEVLSITKKSQHKKWILKSPFSCGGKNIQFISSESEIPDSLSFGHILEPYLDRIVDLSLYYDPVSQDEFYYISHIHKNCTYLGGRVYQNRSMLDQDLKNDGLYDVFIGVIQKLKSYLELLKQNKLTQPLTLDSFLYRDNNTIKGYPLCETNYRISMGSLNKNISRFLPENGVGLLLALKADEHKDWKSMLPYSSESKTGIISLNEGNPESSILFLCAKDLKTLHKYNQLVFNFEK